MENYKWRMKGIHHFRKMCSNSREQSMNNRSMKNFTLEQKLILALRLYYSAFELKMAATKMIIRS